MKNSRWIDRARISEIFSSLQGEGLRIGQRHLFIRFETCHLSCSYCDEREKSGREMMLPEVLRVVDRLEKKYGPHPYVSLTGGEPLLCPEFLRRLCSQLKLRQYKILLETSGILWHELGTVIQGCDLIAMDFKLPSVGQTKDFLEEHSKFLKIAKSKELYIKIPVSLEMSRKEFEAHLRKVAAIAPRVPIFLQPVIRRQQKGCPRQKFQSLLTRWQRIGVRMRLDIRIGIQLHKILNIS